MKIAIISDTHIRNDLEGFKIFMKTELEYADIIIHAGDFISDALVKYLLEDRRFIGVQGNVDSVQSSSLLREKEIITLESYKVGIFHGHGNLSNTLDRVREAFKSDEVDIIIFGHSHKPLITTINKVLYLNPGSPSSKRTESWFSYIILNLSKGLISVELKLCKNSFIIKQK